jgi:uncharacterized membrane protein
MERLEMPLARYFFLVGGVLLALVFISDLYLPKSPVAERTADIDRQVIRIHSDRKWPERIVFDTSLPTTTPAPAQEQASVAPPAAAAAAPDEAKARVRESFAQLAPPSDSRHVHVAELRKPEARPQRKRKLVRRRLGPPPVMLAQQPQFGFFGNTWW